MVNKQAPQVDTNGTQVTDNHHLNEKHDGNDMKWQLPHIDEATNDLFAWAQLTGSLE